MRRGKLPWTAKISDELRARVEEAVDAGALSPREIYGRFNLHKHVRFSPFRQWIYRRRHEGMARAETRTPEPEIPEPVPDDMESRSAVQSSSSPVPASPEAIFDAALDSMAEALASGRVKPHVLPNFVKAILALRYVVTKESGDRRAEERHALELAELVKKQDAALQALAGQEAGPAQLTPQQVAEIRLRVLGL